MEILDKRRLPFVQIEKALVMSRDLSHAGFRIYCALACRANAEGKAWPSLTRLARDLGMGKSTVCRAIAEIEKAKLVTVDRGDAEAGDPDHNVYVLTGYPVQNGTGGPLQYRGGPLAYRGGPPAYRNENTLNEKSVNEKESSLRSLSASGPSREHFDDFWTAYPRKLGKGDARRAWLRLRPDAVLRAAMLTAITTQRGSPDWQRDDGRFIPYPATWLNGRRWEDEPDGGGETRDALVMRLANERRAWREGRVQG